MEPVINDGDLVLVKKGPVEDGQIAVIVKDYAEACVSKIQHLPDQDQLMLISRNPDYPPQVMSTDECVIIGRVIFRLGEPKW